VPLSTIDVLVGLVLLFVASLPLGLVILRSVEWAVHHRFQLSVPERVISAFYATGGLLFAVASIPLPLYTRSAVIGLLVLGGLVLAILWWREKLSSFRTAGRWLTSWPGLLLMGGTLGLLGMEVIATGTQLFPNANDGSFQSLYVQLLLSGHTLPWTYEPFATIGIVYPAGATVWLSMPIVLFSWSIDSAPVALPVFFLSLSTIGAYCWGERLGGFATPRGWQTGLLFAAFFGLIGSWPRLFVGGSYDFAFALPLFLTVLGWLRPFVRQPVPDWGPTVVFGAVLGIATSLSVAVGEMLAVLFVGHLIFFHKNLRLEFERWLARGLALFAIGAAFVTRSLVGLAMWYSYPGHVLSPLGNPPYAPVAVGPGPTSTSPIIDLDPFLLFKPKVSPIPILSLELQILLAVGLVLLAVWWMRPLGRLRRWIDKEVVAGVCATTVVCFAFTAVLSASTPPPVGTSLLVEITSEYEASFLLFICYQAIAIIPLLAAVEYLRSGPAPSSTSPPAGEIPVRRPRFRLSGSRAQRRTSASLAVFVVASLGIGAGVTATTVPGYLQNHLDQLANVTADDVNALEWAGNHLPSCSRVLAAPYSAAMFLNLYANVRLVFPAFPLSTNLSYYIAVANLTHGIYSNATRQALVQLGITEVFVTGQTSVSYPPFVEAPLKVSSDFTPQFLAGDAGIFLFDPGVASTGCEPS
jgi:hypothetical protein